MNEEVDIYKELAEELEKIFGRTLTAKEIVVLDAIGMPEFKVGDEVHVPFEPRFTVAKIITGNAQGQRSWYYAPEGSTLFTAEFMLKRSGG